MKHLAEIKDWKELINEVVCGDCLEGMKLIPDKSIDLVLTDPPYGIGFDKSIKTKAGINKFGKMRTNAIYHEESWDNSIPEKRIFDNMKRISFNQIVWGGNYFIEQGLFNSSCWLVWHKKIKDNSNFADCELAWTSFRTSVRYFQLGWVGLDGVNYGKEKRLHPTQKPVELMRWILQNYSKEGDLICDPFMGSWTTARACKDLGRNFIGFELSEKYCEIGEKRLQQQNLF